VHPDYILDGRPHRYVVVNKDGLYMYMSPHSFHAGNSISAVEDINQASVFPIRDYDNKRHEPCNPDIKSFCDQAILVSASEETVRTVHIDKSKQVSHRKAVELTYLKEADTPLYDEEDQRIFYNVEKLECGKITGYESKTNNGILDLTEYKDELEFFSGAWGACVARLKLVTV
jgi:hypothetical protein